jgi:chromosomal replication initiator protein
MIEEENSYILHLALTIANQYTREEIQQMLDNDNKLDGMSLNEYIMDLNCKVFEVNVQDIKGRSRKYNVNLCRQMIMYFIREYNQNISLKQIGVFLGGRDHATIINGIRQIEGHLYNDVIKSKYDFIDSQIKATLCLH